jgi:hypothetical protein
MDLARAEVVCSNRRLCTIWQGSPPRIAERIDKNARIYAFLGDHFQVLRDPGRKARRSQVGTIVLSCPNHRHGHRIWPADLAPLLETLPQAPTRPERVDIVRVSAPK